MSIEYKINQPVAVDQYIELLKSSKLEEHRPIEDRDCMAGMISNSNLIVSAWDKSTIVGIARSMTDFHYTCYLSDLAVSQKYQNAGIGKRLQAITQKQLGPRCKMILIAAPEANSYYEHLGYINNQFCWVLTQERNIGS